MIVLKFAEDLFTARKRGKIPPFLFVLEEAHNFCPEKGLGQVASSRIIRTIASEGRKFGMGLMVVSQRPANVDKNVLSQCNTQVILKVTNPNDLKAISESVEGMATGVKEDIRDLPVGVAMIVGITDQPLIVDIRIRKSEHGGDTVKMQQRRSEEEPDSSGSPYQMFQPKVPREEIVSRHKGADAVDFLKYPLWRISHKGKSVYADGLTGLLVFEKDSSLERSPAIPKEPATIHKELSELSLSGITLEPSVQQASLSERLPGLKAEKIELVYYPYWLVKKKGKKILVDAIHQTIDTHATEAAKERV
jgi:hypothetical protein